MPLSFSSMLGGMCTLIGTSTNLVLNAQVPGLHATTRAPKCVCVRVLCAKVSQGVRVCKDFSVFVHVKNSVRACSA
eukprot:4468517-Pleurochrysis_carterae.AAC.1